MRPYRFTIEDMYVGRKLICIKSFELSVYTVGFEYEIIESNQRYKYAYRITDDDSVCGWSLDQMNDDAVRLYPLDKLTDKELFLFRLSGRLPE